MVPRPPLPFGLGTDVCRISRVCRIIAPPQSRSQNPFFSSSSPTSSSASTFSPSSTSTSASDSVPVLNPARLSRFLHRIFPPRERAGFEKRWGPLVSELINQQSSPNQGINFNHKFYSSHNITSHPKLSNTLNTSDTSDITRACKELDEKLHRLSSFLSGRWAAKEAAIKAATLASLSQHPSHTRVRLHQVLLSSQTGPVRCVILDEGDGASAGGGDGCYCSDISTSKSLDDDWSDVKGQEGIVSISHDGDYAFATCIIPCSGLTSESRIASAETTGTNQSASYASH